MDDLDTLIKLYNKTKLELKESEITQDEQERLEAVKNFLEKTEEGIGIMSMKLANLAIYRKKRLKTATHGS